MSNYAFFVKYTYSNECALLAYNFHELVTKLRIFEHFTYRHDQRLISVTLAYIFYRYQVHHCDMALDLAVTLVYLEEAVVELGGPGGPGLKERNKDAFNLICYLAFLAHTFNADRTIRLADWYKEIGWRSFRSCQQLNGYVFQLFSQVRKFRLRVSEHRVKRSRRWVPLLMHSTSSTRRVCADILFAKILGDRSQGRAISCDRRFLATARPMAHLPSRTPPARTSQ
jgi:hypothetical protein